MQVKFVLNGSRTEADVQPDTTLLHYLRDVRGLMGTKNGCAQGHCGACTVLIDDRPTRACLMRVAQLEGRAVETVEGLASVGTLHPIQTAYLAAGAVQCGFCTPGFVMATKALLLQHPDPTEDQIREGLRHNICRCTGYVKIIDAVRLAAELMLHSEEPDGVDARDADERSRSTGLGVSTVDFDGADKVRGSLVFADDLSAPGMLHAAVTWSGHPHAEILGVESAAARAMPGVRAVLTAADVPGHNGMGSLKPDQPVLCADKVRYVGDAVALVVADTEAAARSAAAAITVTYRELPGVFSPGGGLAPEAAQIHDGGNVCKHLVHEVGDSAAALAAAAVVVHGSFKTPFVEHAYLEPECALAEPDGDGGIVLRAPTQFPFELRRQLAVVLDLPEERVRVIATPLGGAFGSKLDNTVEALAGVAARVLQRPVKVTLTRPESIRMSTKRHACELDYVVGLNDEGRILAVDAKLLADAGPYTTLSPRVIDQACIFSCGPYRVPNLRVEGWAVHTNNANGSAFRGFGINQAAVAIESLLDDAARQLGLDPFELRLRNALEAGDTTISGEILRASVATAATLTATRDALTCQFAALATRTRPGWRLGIGVASGFKNVGAGKGKVDDAGAILSLQPDGRILLRASAVDMGQGIRTALLQIAGEVLGLPPERFDLITGDTARTIRHGGAVGERQTLIAGRAVELATSLFAEAVLTRAAALIDRPSAALRLDGPTIRDHTGRALLTWDNLAEQLAGLGEELEVSYYHVAPTTYALSDAEARRSVPPEEYRNYPAYAYATQAAVVEVEEATGKVRVLKIVAAHDCGRVINPQKIEGQIEGSCLQGLGYALSEAYLLEQGHPTTRTYRQLGVPSIFATPEIEVILIEDPEPSGPFGAKGISEVATVPVTPAILNAIFDATGVRVTTLPADPNQIRAGMLSTSPHWWSVPSD